MSRSIHFARTKLRIAGLMLIAVLATGSLRAQLACNDLIQVSLDENCTFTVNLDMVLEAPPLDTICLILVIKDQNGQVVPNNIFNSSHRNQSFVYSVIDTCSANSCWGELKVEDKLPPLFRCMPNDTVWCSQDRYVLPADIVFEACSRSNRVIISDETVNYPCDSAWSGKRFITYLYEDADGNQTDTCVKQVCYRRATLEDLVFPEDTIFDCMDFVDSNPQRTGVPEVDSYPIFPDAYFCEINCTFEDTPLEICPSSFKILRKWTCYDWCLPTGPDNPTIEYQVIKVLDEEGPVVYCPTDPQFRDTVGTDIWQCTGSTLLPEPIVLQPGENIVDSTQIYIISECSDVSYTVRHLAATNPEDCIPGPGLPNSNHVRFNRVTGRWQAFDLPLGCNWFYYTFTDECGNTTKCAFDIYIEDDVPPVPVCDHHTVVTLNDSGLAKIFAPTFDDGSVDNCEIDSFDVRRMDSQCTPETVTYGDYVVFCCADLGKTVMVEFRVHDKAGNVNTCMVEVEVHDKQPPHVIPPPHITIDCRFDFDIDDLSVFGKVVIDEPWRKDIFIKDPHYAPSFYAGRDGLAFDNCEDIIITEREVINLECGKGTIRRIFKATDPGGLMDSAVQIITITDLNPFGREDIKFPIDRHLKGCTGGGTDTSATGVPEFSNVHCATVAATFDDQIFTGESDACYKIERTWTVIDWCQFDVRQNSGIWSKKQIIKVSDNDPPVFNNCQDMTFCDENAFLINEECHGNVNIVPDVSDKCTPVDQIQLRYRIDEFNTGSFGPWTPGKEVNSAFPVGTHRIEWSAEDGCDNEARCEFLFTVKDCKKPTPYCRNGIVTVLMEGTGEIAIWANDYDLNSTDNCTSPENLRFSFSEDINDTGRSYNCDSLNGAVSIRRTLRVYVWDECDNFDYCETVIEIQDNGKCTGNLGSVSGAILDQNGDPMKDVLVELKDPNSGNTVASANTDIDGNYMVTGLPLNESYMIKPVYDVDDINGVTTRDLVLIQRDLLGYTPLGSPYRILASDANYSNSKTARDISEIRKLILGKYAKYPSHDSWTFVPADYVFEDDLQPWAAPTEMPIPLMSKDLTDRDFVAIKVGDVNEDHEIPGINGIKTRGGSNYDMTYKINELHNGDQQVVLYKNDKWSLSGMQMTLDFGAEIMEADVVSGLMQVSNSNMAIHTEKITFSWAELDGVADEDTDVLFSIVIRSENGIQHVELTSEITVAEAYSIDDEQLNLTLRGGKLTEGNFVLMQNIPNPFGESTLISFELPDQQDFKLSFYDPSGRTLKVINGMGAKGYNQLVINQSDFPSHAGNIVFYQLDTRDNSATRKLIIAK